MRRIWGTVKLLRMLRLLLAQDALLPPDYRSAPRKVKIARFLFTIGAPRLIPKKRQNYLSDYIRKLGPSYIKLGQFLATRPDLLGEELARDLQHLQDKLPPFDPKIIPALMAEEIPDVDFLGDMGVAVAAASVAQVHKVESQTETGRFYAVKILRPHIRDIMRREIRSFYDVARFIEFLFPAIRRLQPIETVATIERLMETELDLRYEAAALDEISENQKSRTDFAFPQIIWEGCSKNILVMEWVDGIPAHQIDKLKAAGHDMRKLACTLFETFLYQALFDGFFHADLHQGNMLIRDDGKIIGLDLGITGRLDKETRRTFAHILHGFVSRDYQKIARVHFEAGYVPPDQSAEKFAQALRSIGEPRREKSAANISMAHLLGQLFEVTGQFQMQTQPQLIMLQRTLMTVEGVARSWAPEVNYWDEVVASIIEKWMRQEIGPQAMLEDIRETALAGFTALQKLPQTLENIEAGAQNLKNLNPTTQTNRSFWRALFIALAIFGSLNAGLLFLAYCFWA